MKPDNLLQFEINKKLYPICSFSFSQQLEAPCGTFELKVPEIGDFYTLVGSEVSLCFGSWKRTCILDAIDIDWPSDIVLSGRDLTSLIVDSSAEVVSFPDEQTFISIAKKLCAPFNIEVKDPSNVGSFKLKKFSVTPGDSVFETLEKAAKIGGVFFTTKDGRSLEIFYKNKGVSKELNDLSPLTKLHIRRNISDVFGKYIAHIESKEMFGKTKTLSLKDAVGNKFKQKIVSLSEGEDPAKALALEAILRRAKSKSVSFSLPGIVDFYLGDNVSLSLTGFSDTGMITQIEYSISLDAEEYTRITLGDM